MSIYVDQYVLSREVFLGGMAFIYVCAFSSWLPQIAPLYDVQYGVSPVELNEVILFFFKNIYIKEYKFIDLFG